jgi:sulfite reductase (NADPH) flavoprotein alpha-component
MEAPVLDRRSLSTEREVLHLSLRTDFPTVPGDTVGVLAPQRCEALLEWLGSASPELRADLTWKYGIDRATQKLARAVGLPMELDEDVLSYLVRAGSKLDPRPFLGPHLPRAYSVASSVHAHPGETHLCVAVLPKGVASTFLRDLDPERDKVEVMHKPTRNFRIADDPAADLILVGPGTGIAPFRALIQERSATRALTTRQGRTWLFTGGRTEGDVLYQRELSDFDRLDVALSRVGPEKVYVQDLMLRHGAEVWSWIANGAHLYVCGDGKRMAKAVHAALVAVAREHGGIVEAERWVSETLGKTERRYKRDVW